MSSNIAVVYLRTTEGERARIDGRAKCPGLRLTL